MGKKEKVLIVHNYYQIPGGEDTVVANEKKMLEENGHEVVFYSRNNAELKEMSKVQKIFLPVTTVFNRKTYQDIKAIICEYGVDVVHVHNTLNLISPAVYYAAVKCKTPVVQTIHNFRLLCPGATFYRDEHICEDCVKKGLLCALKYSCYRGSKLQTLACVISTKVHRIAGIYGKLNYICLTAFNKEKLLELKQIKPENVYVKPNFVEQSVACNEAIERDNQFVFAGRLDKLKGIDILLEAWKLMGVEAPRLIVCGEGPMLEWCKTFVEDNRLTNVECKGFVPNKDAKDIIAKSKALILPTQWYEGFPMSIVEAYSVGTPVLCSDIGNAASIVVDGITGLKFHKDSPEDIVQAVKSIVEYSNIHKTTVDEYKKKYTAIENYTYLKSIYECVRR